MKVILPAETQEQTSVASAVLWDSCLWLSNSKKCLKGVKGTLRKVDTQHSNFSLIRGLNLTMAISVARLQSGLVYLSEKP